MNMAEDGKVDVPEAEVPRPLRIIEFQRRHADHPVRNPLLAKDTYEQHLQGSNLL
jgi:hypothetical protein